MPEFLHRLRARAENFAAIPHGGLQQVLITEYPPGAAIGWHKDRSATPLVRRPRWLVNKLSHRGSLLSTVDLEESAIPQVRWAANNAAGPSAIIRDAFIAKLSLLGRKNTTLPTKIAVQRENSQFPRGMHEARVGELFRDCRQVSSTPSPATQILLECVTQQPHCSEYLLLWQKRLEQTISSWLCPKDCLASKS